jgi:hypothetical protein
VHGPTIPIWGWALIFISGILFGSGSQRLLGPKMAVILAVIVAAGVFFLLSKGA